MKKLFVSLACMLLSASALAQIVTAKGSSTITYNGKVTPQEKERAYKAAQVAAVERYFMEAGEAEAENFEGIKDKVEANLEEFIGTTTVLSEQEQASFSKYTLVLKTEIMVPKLRSVLRANSAAGKADPNSRSNLVFLFVAREAASVKSFDARVVQRQDIDAKGKLNATTTDNGKEGEAISGSSVATSATRNQKVRVDGSSSVTVTTGGSSTQKTDEMSYRLLSMANHQSSVTSVFSQSGFKVVDSFSVLGDGDVGAVNRDYSKGNDLSGSTMRAIVAALRKQSVPMVVLATLDVGVPDADPSTGLRRVAVTVTARVLDVKGQFPREVASVPAVQYIAMGSDNAMASNNAVKQAAISASREIVSRLAAGGVY